MARPPDLSWWANRRSRDGFALLAVLTGTVLVGLLATGLIATTRSEAAISRNLVEQAQAQALVDGAVRLAIAALADRPAGLRRDGTPTIQQLGGVAVELAVQEAGGLVDLNFGAPALLAAAFGAAGAGPDTARLIAERIAARRARRPFELVEELRSLPDLPRDLAVAAHAFLTVQSRQAGIDPDLAPTALRARLGDEFPAALRSTSAGDVFVVRGRLAGSDSGLVVREAEIRFTSLAQDPVWLHGWRDGR